ncbi:MAG: hypothetical protein LBS00_02725, partial [Synergistaceae bacterium]|nr:hypothetical protein [Synergistaceae bacterium]
MQKRKWFGLWALLLLGAFAATLTAPAWANDGYTIISHRSVADLVDGKPNYATAEFGHISFWIDFEPGLTNPQAGTFSVNDPFSYSYLGTDGQLHEGADKDFPLAVDSTGSGYTEYTPVDENGSILYFRGKAQNRQTGLPNKSFHWSTDEGSGNGKVMDFLTTEEQLGWITPYVELSDSAVTYKSYRPSSGSDAAMPFSGSVRVRLYNAGGRVYQTAWIPFSQGVVMNGSLNLGGIGVARSDVTDVRVQIRAASSVLPDGSYQNYDWMFTDTGAGPVKPVDPIIPSDPITPDDPDPITPDDPVTPGDSTPVESSLNGTWRIESGGESGEDYGVSYEYLYASSDPSTFPIQVTQRSNGLYTITLNVVVGWESPPGVSMSGFSLEPYSEYQKVSEREYYASEGNSWISWTYVDDSTWKLESADEDTDWHSKISLILKRVTSGKPSTPENPATPETPAPPSGGSDNSGSDNSGSGGGGCASFGGGMIGLVILCL